MKPLDAAGAFAAYEAVRHRLPAVTGDGACRLVANINEIAAGFDVFLLDAFGVLNIGETAIPGVPERIAGLRAAGKRLVVLTNAASLPHRALVEKFERLGYSFPPEDIVSSRICLLDAVRAAPPRRWGVMAADDRGPDPELAGLNTLHLGDEPEPYDAAEGFLFLGSASWNEHRQQLLAAALRQRPRPVLVGNPDIIAPRETGFTLEPGYFAHHLADRLDRAPRFFGKPFGNVFELSLARLDRAVRPERVLMVGDSLHTDVLGARAAGVASALVTDHGFFENHPVQAAIETSGIRPDFILGGM